MTTIMASQKRRINIYYQNFNGIQSKREDIRRELRDTEYDIICGTESRIQSDFMSSEICPSDIYFTVHRKDRDLIHTRKQGGGGCIAIVRNSLNVKRLHRLEALRSNEELWLSVMLRDGYELYLCVPYLSPSSSHDDYVDFFENTTNIRSELPDKSYVMLLGDFNIHMTWRYLNNHFVPHEYEGRIAESLVHFIECNARNQFNGVRNDLGRILDLCLSDMPPVTISLDRAEPVCRVDRHHPPLHIEIDFEPVRIAADYDIPQYNFRRADYKLVNRELSNMDWNTCLGSDEVNGMVERFYDRVNEVIQRTVPVRRPRSNKYPIWFSRELINMLKKKAEAHRRYKRNQDDRSREMFKMLRRESKLLIRKCERSYMENLQMISRTQVKPFWSYVKSLRKSNTMPETMNCKSNTYVGTDELCEGFVTYFNSVHTSSFQTLPPPDFNVNSSGSFRFAPVSEEEVLRVMRSLKTDKGMGHDNISNVFIKNTASSLAYPFALIFHRIVTTSPQEFSVGRQSVSFIWSETDEIGLMSVRTVCMCIRMAYDRIVIHS